MGVQKAHRSLTRVLAHTRHVSIEVQKEIGQYWVDLLLAHRLIIEIDGRSKYDGCTYGVPVDSLVRAERRRENALRHEEWLVMRFEAQDLIDFGNTCRMIEVIRQWLAKSPRA